MQKKSARQQAARSEMQKKAKIFCDGASSGNPGASGIGIVIIIDNHKYTFSEYIGKATNNIAEYIALVRGLQELKKHGVNYVDICTDSELMVRQIKGQYKVRSENLTSLYKEAISSLSGFIAYSITHIPRERNTEADNLAKKAIRKGLTVNTAE